MATPVTTKRVNKALAAAGIAGEVSKAEGVYYLIGDDFAACAETCLHLTSLQQTTPAAIVAEAKRMIAEALQRTSDPADAPAAEEPAPAIEPEAPRFHAAVLAGRKVAYVHHLGSGAERAACGVGVKHTAGWELVARDVDCPKCQAAVKRAGGAA